jgi:hypothetical protein
MCGDGGSGAAAERAAAESSRQAEIERQRLAEEAAAAKAEAERRAVAEQARWEAQFNEQKTTAEALRRQIAETEANRLAEQSRIEAGRKAERDAELARQDQERRAAEAATAKKASDLARYNTERQGLVDKARGGIESAFAGYNDGYYNNYAGDYVASMVPRLDEQFADARKATKYSFADRGNLDSMAAGQRFGRLETERTRAAADIGQQAQSAANSLRSNVEAQRAKLLDSVFGALGAAPVITADNVGEANDALSRVSTAINTPVSLASGAAASFNTPAFGTLDQNIFTLPTAGVPRTSVASGGGANPYSVGRRSSSGRLVN